MFRKSLIKALLIGGLSLTAMGQSAPAIDPQKLTLLKELLVATDIKQITEKLMETQFVQIESNFPQMMGAMVPNTADLPQETQEKIRQKALAGGIRAMKKFRTLYGQRIEIGAIVEQMYLPIYDKYFSTDNVKDLLAFYRTPAGKKWVASMPQINQEASQKSSELLLPKITAIMTEVMEEERALLAKELEQEFPPPPPPSPAPKSRKPVKKR